MNPIRECYLTGGFPACYCHAYYLLLYINHGLELLQRAFSPIIIIEDLHLQTFLYSLVI